MNVYLDSSVLLRVILRQPDRLVEWPQIERAVASSLLEVECLRTLDRLRLAGVLDEEVLVAAREAVYRFTAEIELVELTPAVMRQASQPLATALGTLDAIHLATLLLWSETRGDRPVMATHDRALGRAARAMGFTVIGV